MGMESFFVSVLSKKMLVNYNDTRKVEGYDERFNLNWYELLKEDFDLNIIDDYILVNNIVELYCKKTSQEGIYITLVGCLSCFCKALNEMNKIIEKISSVINDIPSIFVLGNIYPYDKGKFIMILASNYSEKKKVFDSMYHERITVYPSKFYEEYERNNSIFSKIRKYFKK